MEIESKFISEDNVALIMVFESALANTLLITLVSAGVISGLATLASDTIKWGWKKFLYTFGLASIAGLAVVQTQFDGVVTEGNAIVVFLAIFGGSIIGNKLVKISQKLKE